MKFQILIILLFIGMGSGCRSEKGNEAEPEQKGVEETPLEKPEETTSENRGIIRGKVLYGGIPAELQPIPIDKDIEICGNKKKFSEELIVSKTDRGIKNVVVSIVGEGLKPAPPSPTKLQLDQRGCWFYPHVQVISVGEPLEILNSDGILHNIHTLSIKNPPINKAQPGFKKKMEEKFEFPEIIKVKCDAHPWMGGWLVVAEHEYYTLTDESGSFHMENVPAGIYTIEFWHETLGKKTEEVQVKPNEEVKIEIQLNEK